MTLSYTEHEAVSLKNHPEFNEAWLQGVIADNPLVLGLGDLLLIQKERIQESRGRLDLLLADESDARYEVELQLGATDESHIIRCIEYWDVERRRYPGYDHVAVLVAEDVTSRFLNVLGLLAGTIPLVVLQLDALKVGSNLVLDFVKVLDQRDLRIDDVGEVAVPADRNYWKKKRGTAPLRIVDEMLELVNSHVKNKQELNFTRSHIGLKSGGRVDNFVVFYLRNKFVHARFRLSEPKPVLDLLEEAGLEARIRGKNRLTVTLRSDDVTEHKEMLDEVVQRAVREAQA